MHYLSGASEAAKVLQVSIFSLNGEPILRVSQPQRSLPWPTSCEVVHAVHRVGFLALVSLLGGWLFDFRTLREGRLGWKLRSGKVGSLGWCAHKTHDSFIL